MAKRKRSKQNRVSPVHNPSLKPAKTTNRAATVQQPEASTSRNPANVDQTNTRVKTVSGQNGASDEVNQSTKSLNLSKRSRADEADDEVESGSKRTKLNGTASLGHRSISPIRDPKIDASAITNSASDPIAGSDAVSQASPSSANRQLPAGNAATQEPGVKAVAAAYGLPVEMEHLQAKYEISTMSIISSSKMEHRVRNLLERASKAPASDVKAKPGVVVLHAYGNVAGKMISIVEIAKKQIEKENGQWWQYSKLHSEKKPFKPKQRRKRAAGEVMADEEHESARSNSPALEDVEGSKALRGAQEDVVAPDEVGDQEDAFETMQHPKQRLNGGDSMEGQGKRIRAVAVMTIFFARVPLPALKELYGEQTNAQGNTRV
ncbi:hypothetical protein MMC21_006922 [Puttea exsequens]|nr:hypothetical protein [Puttea exsequens]